MSSASTKTANVSEHGSRMSSPKDQKKSVQTKEEAPNKEAQDQQSQPETQSATQAADSKSDGEKPKSNAQPLAPPPKPSQATAETPDYFSGNHGNSHFSLEPNPFEQSFRDQSGDTPGKVLLPSVASLTSPAPLNQNSTPGWQNSLRSGPLSPAMLQGPTNSNGGYFDESFRGSFPTPNESSLRTGLTPGGGGSMFPAASPNSQALFQSLQQGGATPGTLEFQRTAMSAAARSKVDAAKNTPQNMAGASSHGINKQEYQPASQSTANQFQNHSETDAVNSLFMLSNAGNRSANQFAVQGQSQSGNVAQMQQRVGQQSQNTSPTMQHGRQSIGGMSESGVGASENGDYEGSDMSNEAKPSPRGRGKKGSSAKGGQATNGRRKADDTPGKTPAGKRSKGNNGAISDMMSDNGDDQGDDLDDEIKKEGDGAPGSGKKLTDEEKRKNFLERNRVAALKCRQRKKQWLANLQTKVEIFTQENDALTQQCNALREEIVNLKTLLLAHKDCPVSHSQGLGGNAMAQVIGSTDFPNNHANPYGLAMGNGQMMNMQSSQGMQRS